MSDTVTLARAARESLARGLNALQADPKVPPQILDLAAPIAQAMGALHQIERSGGAMLAANAQTALTCVQTALAQLQAQPQQQQAVVSAMESVAGALGSVHSLVRATQAQQPAAPAPAQPAPVAMQPRAAVPQPPPPQPAPAPRAAPAPQPAAHAPPPAAYAPPQQPPAAARAAPAAAPPAGYPAAPAAQPAPRAYAPAGDAPVVPAELGAHSPSNFYKGLSGNDIVDHGGLFVSTYKLPKLGAPVRLKVSLPGGYEFEANAIVRWRREANDGGSDAPPGFGAQFTEITPEARQLVYRYVRNREPMFHDDL